MELSNPDLLRKSCYINGEWVQASDNSTLDVTNPANGEVIAHVPKLGMQETRDAIEAAHSAWPLWRSQTAKSRAAILRRFYDLVLQNKTDLARIMTAEQGKPLSEAEGEVLYAASYLEWFAEEAKRVYGDTIPGPSADKRLVVIKEPVGVVAAVTPWNFPLAMITRKCAPALAAGCPVVIKPASETPLSALALASLADEAGVPKGILNVITGSASAIGGELTANPLVRKLTFTGSTEVGKILTRQCADTMKKVSMELGGNAPLIVFDDADLDAAVDGAMISKYRNTGQTCVCANRLYVQDGIYEDFVDRLVKKVTEMTVGDGADPGVNLGPLINLKAVDNVENIVADAISKGAQVACGGARLSLGENFYQPTILTEATRDMDCASEEIFGPVAPVFRFSDEKQVIDLANDTEVGLASYLFTRDIGRVWRVSEALEYGMVGINTGIISNEAAPFGGVKQSGMGREGSKYGLDDYMEIKYLCMGGIDQ